MKTKTILMLLLIVLVPGGFIIWMLMRGKNALSIPSSQVRNTETATPPTAFSKWLGLGTNYAQTGTQAADQTGQLITASGNAFGNIAKSFADLFKTSTPAVASPIDPNFLPTAADTQVSLWNDSLFGVNSLSSDPLLASPVAIWSDPINWWGGGVTTVADAPVITAPTLTL